ncbi:PLAT/LH2 domain [Sesbania bispinosa]|nr:PLAT/LH2 domain [Sesbania bispinosa]
MAIPNRFFPLLFLLSLSLCFTGTVRSEEDCVYTVYIRTGSIIKGGTDSIIGLKLYDAYGYGIYITNLEAWGGLMDPGYNYFERGNLDIFSGRGPCLDGPVCAVNLTSDGSGPHHGWYCNYVEVTSTGVHTPCAQQQFTVEQWLATDTSPYQLWTVRNYCNYDLGQARFRTKAATGDGIRSGSDFSILGSTVRV